MSPTVHFSPYLMIGPVSFELPWLVAVMKATTGIQLAIDAFRPIANNACGNAEMSHLPKEAREVTDGPDAR